MVYKTTLRERERETKDACVYERVHIPIFLHRTELNLLSSVDA